MAVPKLEYTPVKTQRGKEVHAVTLSQSGKAACGKAAPRRGWLVVPELLSCLDCKAALHMPVKAGRPCS